MPDDSTQPSFDEDRREPDLRSRFGTADALRELLQALSRDARTFSIGWRDPERPGFGRDFFVGLRAALAWSAGILFCGMVGLGTIIHRRWTGFWRHALRPVAQLVILAVCLLPAAVLIWALHTIQFPSPQAVTSQGVAVLQASDGQDIFGKGNIKLPVVDAGKMSPNVVNAVLSIEDRRFYQHGGIDVVSMLRALIQNVGAGKIVGGGSTITQQLVKTLFVGPQRTYKRKIQEAAIAIWLEFHLTKDQILTSYLNNVYLGSGAVGFPAAAKVYFDKDVADLTVPEAAMLAGMINAPSRDDPFVHPDAALTRTAAVLDAMVDNGKLSRADAAAAKRHPATPRTTALSPPSAGWFADWIGDKAAQLAAAAGGSRVRTTLDLRLQDLADRIVKSTLARYGNQKHATQAALVAMRPDGAVLAMVGGRSYRDSQFNRAVSAKRQPGSSFKLFDYFAALRQGYTPDDEILDEPIDVNGWEPANDSDHYHGEVTLADAFAHSLNAAAVRLTQNVGINHVIEAARTLGLHAPLANDPSLALGTSEVTLLDLTSAYATVLAGVTPVEPFGIAEVSAPDGQQFVPVNRPKARQYSLGQYRGELIDLLQGVVQHGTGRAAALPGFAAGKTGTSQDYRDAWFVGFDDTLVVGVWVGNDDHSPMRGVVGGSLPAMIWKQFMEQAGPTATTVATTTTPTATGSVDATPVPPEDVAANGRCNIPVCEQYYHSFRASDCTYQPYNGGPRQYCDRGGDARDSAYGYGNPRRSNWPTIYDLFAPRVDARPSGW